MVRKFVAVALVALGLGLSACNTVEGAGKDTQAAGKAISNEARKDK